jgi:hypothetical protein
MSATREYLELRFQGAAGPSDFHSRDIADALVYFEQLIKAMLRREAPDVTVDDVIVGLVEIREGSNGLRFRASHMPKALAAYEVAARAVAEQKYDALDGTAREALVGIQRVSIRYDSAAEFRTHAQDGRPPLATLQPDEEIPEVEAERVTGTTTIHGRVERVGGKTPKAWIQTSDRSKVIVDVNEEQAQHLANRLYHSVALRGRAVWNLETETIEEFDLHEILPSKQKGVKEAFAELSEAVGDVFEGVDPVAYTRWMRGDEEEVRHDE